MYRVKQFLKFFCFRFEIAEEKTKLPHTEEGKKGSDTHRHTQIHTAVNTHVLRIGACVCVCVHLCVFVY